MEKNILAIIQETLKNNNLNVALNEENKQKNLKELGIDSIVAFSIIANIEEKLGFQLTDDEIIKLKNFNDLINCFKNKKK